MDRSVASSILVVFPPSHHAHEPLCVIAFACPLLCPMIAGRPEDRGGRSRDQGDGSSPANQRSKTVHRRAFVPHRRDKAAGRTPCSLRCMSIWRPFVPAITTAFLRAHVSAPHPQQVPVSALQAHFKQFGEMTDVVVLRQVQTSPLPPLARPTFCRPSKIRIHYASRCPPALRPPSRSPCACAPTHHHLDAHREMRSSRLPHQSGGQTSRCFGFVTFADPAAAERALVMR